MGCITLSICFPRQARTMVCVFVTAGAMSGVESGRTWHLTCAVKSHQVECQLSVFFFFASVRLNSGSVKTAVQ